MSLLGMFLKIKRLGTNNMNKPKPIERPTILDYHEIISYIEKKYEIDVRDYAGKFSGKGREESDKLKDEWLDKNGHLENKHVFNKPNGSREDWAKDSKEMQLRIELNTKMQKENFDRFLDKRVPYLDYWHYLLEHDFCEIHNGCDEYWGLKDILEDEKAPDWIKEITQLVYDEFKEYVDEDGGFNVHISW